MHTNKTLIIRYRRGAKKRYAHFTVFPFIDDVLEAMGLTEDGCGLPSLEWLDRTLNRLSAEHQTPDNLPCLWKVATTYCDFDLKVLCNDA